MSEEAAKEVNIPGINWIASYPKSGNTWIRLLFYVYCKGKFEKLNQLINFTESDTSLSHWMASSPFPWGFLTDERRHLLRYTALMSMILHRGDPDIKFCKTHCANIFYKSNFLIPNELSERSIYILRDPRDVAHSYAHHMGQDIDKSIENMNNQGNTLLHTTVNTGILQPLTTWSNHVTSWLENGEFERIAIRYEDLMVDTENQFTELVEFMFGKVKHKRIKKAVKHTQFQKLKNKENKHGFRETTKNGKFFRQGKIRAWEDLLTTKQVIKIEQDHGEVMERMGYKLEYL
jgi:hypothetical protein